MKTLSKSNGLKKLNNLPIQKSSKAFQIVKEILGGGNKTYQVNGNKIRPCYTSGSGRFTSNQDHTGSVISILNSLKIEFDFTNDATRGSQTGNLITIKTKLK